MNKTVYLSSPPFNCIYLTLTCPPIIAFNRSSNENSEAIELIFAYEAKMIKLTEPWMSLFFCWFLFCPLLYRLPLNYWLIANEHCVFLQPLNGRYSTVCAKCFSSNVSARRAFHVRMANDRLESVSLFQFR